MSQFIVMIDWEDRKISHIKFDDPVSAQEFLEVIFRLGNILLHQADSWTVESLGPSNDMKAVRFISVNKDPIITYQRIN